MKKWVLYLVSGIIFILWGLGWSIGAVSIGYNQDYHSYYLLYSSFVILISLGFLGLGSYFVFKAGELRSQQHANQLKN
ncbi:hypothetical protein [Saccharolobus islandicus]|uniref:hypothetical protein n=1 Tax=Saccharolobus islandicus TaxID=43080 RepID=UPI0003605E32|nr:hypothetical protein [Sulfolobus islandicus]